MDPEEVALRALIYRECWQLGYASIDDIITDSELASGLLSFLTLMAADTLRVRDWACLSALYRNGGNFLKIAREHPDVKSTKPWAAPFLGKRWLEIQVYILAVEPSGTTARRDDIAVTFSRAWQQLTGGDVHENLDACEATEAAWS